MKTLLWVLCCLAVLVHKGDSQCPAGETLLNQGQLVIDPACTEAYGLITTDMDGRVPFIYLKSGHLLQSTCWFYNGTDDSGEFLGSATEDGNAAGAIEGISQSIYFYCSLMLMQQVVFSYQVVLFEDCGGDFAAPINRVFNDPVNPGDANVYPHCALCRWKFSSPTVCDYSVVHLSTNTGQGDFLFFNFPDGSPPGGGNPDRFGSATSIISDNGDTWDFRRKDLQIEFVSDDGTGIWDPTLMTYFSFRVTATCEQQECAETTAIILRAEDINQLNATDGDTLYIAPSWDVKPHEVDPRCRSTVQQASFVFPMALCGYVTQLDNGDIAFVYTVWNAKQLDEGNVIQRFYVYNKNFTCVYASTADITSNVIIPQLGLVSSSADPVSGQFGFDFDLFDDDMFSNLLDAGSTITVPDAIFAQINISGLPVSEESFILQMTDCWATENSDSTSEPSYSIVVSSCHAMNDFENPNNIEIIRNYGARYGRFRFNSFAWTNVTDANQRVYVHCDVTVCNSDVPGSDCSAPPCMKRRRREVGIGGKQTFTAGPITLTTHQHDEFVDEADIDHAELETEVDVMPYILVGLIVLIACALYRLKAK